MYKQQPIFQRIWLVINPDTCWVRESEWCNCRRTNIAIVLFDLNNSVQSLYLKLWNYWILNGGCVLYDYYFFSAHLPINQPGYKFWGEDEPEINSNKNNVENCLPIRSGQTEFTAEQLSNNCIFDKFPIDLNVDLYGKYL